MKIVVLDGYTENPGDLSWEELGRLGELTVYDRTSLTDETQIIERIGGAGIVLTNKTPISKNVLDACPGIRYISVLATGYNVVDTAQAKLRGIPVSNVPAYGTMIVAQYAIAMLLEICLHVAHHDALVHQGRWETSPDWCFWDTPLTELDGKTLGILGFGRIGRQTGRIAKAMGMKILACSPEENEEGRTLAQYVELDTLLARSDVIALHCPLLPETEGIINRGTIAKMKDGAVILNNSRGQLIVERDLADALETGKIRAAAVDVVSTEPVRPDNPLLHAKNCLITPHNSWAARESRQRIMECTVDNVAAYLKGKPQHVVNGA